MPGSFSKAYENKLKMSIELRLNTKFNYSQSLRTSTYNNHTPTTRKVFLKKTLSKQLTISNQSPTPNRSILHTVKVPGIEFPHTTY